MKMQQSLTKTIRRRIGGLGVAAALAGAISLAAAPAALAQDTATLPTQNVAITLSNAPVRVALDALFKSTNLNYTIDPNIQESVTVSLRNVPFDVALRAILHSSTPMLQYTVTDGVYKISQPSADQSSQSQASVPDATSFGGGPSAQGPQVGIGPNANVGPNASTSDTKQLALIYLTYAPGLLLQAVVGPVQIIRPELYTPGVNASGGSGGIGGASGGLGGGSSSFGGSGGSSGGSSYGGGSSSFGGGIR